MTDTQPAGPTKIEVRAKLPEPLYQWIEEEAARLGLTVTALVRMVITAKYNAAKLNSSQQAAGK